MRRALLILGAVVAAFLIVHDDDFNFGVVVVLALLAVA